MTKQIKLMAEYDAHPLWRYGDTSEDVGNIDPANLPLCTETRVRLETWAELYTATLNWDDPPSSGFPSAEAEEAFEQEGVSLWKQLRHELAPNYTVVYFSQKLRRLLNDPRELDKDHH